MQKEAFSELNETGNTLSASKMCVTQASSEVASTKHYEIEDILSSRGRIKVIKALLAARAGELNVTEIAKSTRLNHKYVAQHLDFLKRVGFVSETDFGRIRIFRISTDSLFAEALRAFIVKVSGETS